MNACPRDNFAVSVPVAAEQVEIHLNPI